MFLRDFLVEIRDFWARQSPGRLQSGPWTEADRKGMDRHLQATAVFQSERRILLIELLGGEYERKHAVYQSAREQAGALHRLQGVHQALVASQTETANLLRSTPDIMFRLDRQGRYRDFSGPTGGKQEGKGACSVADVFPEPVAKALMKSLARALNAGRHETLEYQTGEEHERRDFEARIAPCGLDEVLVTVRDITERKRQEQQISRLYHQVSTRRDDLLVILNQLDIGVARVSTAGKVEFLSDTAAALLGVDADEIIGGTLNDITCLGREERSLLALVLRESLTVRGRVSLRGEWPGAQTSAIEVDVRDDPRSEESRLLFFYDVAEVEDLRRLVHEKDEFEKMVGRSASMRSVYETIDNLAGVDATVLIEGETGTGKELVARALHRRSRRRDKPFIAVNCGELTETLAASQLFGHERGAFTGTAQIHRGLFEEADGGVIFLDEVGDLPRTIQTSLLRVLQEGEIRRLGASRVMKVDLRVIAATHRDLAEEAEQKLFRQDLFYRLRVGRVRLPPLRDRREDVALLAAHFLSDSRASTGKPVRNFSSDVLKAFMDFPWPGNVRELKNAIEYAVVSCRRATITLYDLPPEILHGVSQDLLPRSAGASSESERLRIDAAFRRTHGNRTHAARLLGMSRATLYRRLAELDFPLYSRRS